MSTIDPTTLKNLEAELDDQTPLPPHHWQSFSQTHVGKVRYNNEDAFYHSDEYQLWAVADGMGGHSRGEYASAAVVKALATHTPKATALENIESLQAGLISANTKCLTAFRGKRMGSTVAAMTVHKGFCFFLWAGDSRIYRLRNGKLKLLTEDHSVAQEKFTRGELSAEQAESHHSAHILTRAVGVHQTLRLALKYSPAELEDRYLICSDGLYSGASYNDIQHLMAESDAESALQSLIQHALSKCGKDNITAILTELSPTE